MRGGLASSPTPAVCGICVCLSVGRSRWSTWRRQPGRTISAQLGLAELLRPPGGFRELMAKGRLLADRGQADGPDLGAAVEAPARADRARRDQCSAPSTP
jgi:hypothetical protein